MSVLKETESITLPRRSQRTIENPLRHVYTISPLPNKHLSCILCNKTLDISNTDHHCEIRHLVEELFDTELKNF